MIEYAGKVAFITGGASGAGFGQASVFAELGCKIVINTDSHHTSHLDKMRYGVRQLRRAWLRKEDVLNTLPAREFLAALRPRPN